MILLAIELDDFTINSGSSNQDIVWFTAGLLVLVAITVTLVWWQRRSKPDPFAE